MPHALLLIEGRAQGAREQNRALRIALPRDEKPPRRRANLLA